MRTLSWDASETLIFCLGEFESSFLRAFADSILTSFMDAFLVIFLVMVQSYVSTPEASNLPLRVFNKHVTWTLLRIREQGFCCAGSTFFGVGQDKHRIEMNWSHPRGKRKVPLFRTSCEGQWEFAARAHGKPAKHAQRSSHCCPRCVGNDVLHYTFWHFFPQDFTNLCIEIAICAGKFQFTPCSPQSALITSCRPFADPGSNTYAAVPVGSLPMQMGVPAGASFPAGTEARPMPRKAVAWGGACLLFLFQRPRLKERRWDTNEASGLRYEHCSRWHCPWHNWKNADWCSTNLSK